MSRIRSVVVFLVMALMVSPVFAKKGGNSYWMTGYIIAMAPARGSFPADLQACPNVNVQLQLQSTASNSNSSASPSPQPPPYIATTDGAGRFQINGLPAGTYALVASRPGVGSATAQVVLGPQQPYVNTNLTLVPDHPQVSAGSAAAPALQSGPTVISGGVFVALASTNPGHPSLASSAGRSTTSTSSGDSANSFGKNIPGPPAYSMGAITALQNNGGDPYLFATGHKRPDVGEGFKEGHTVIQASNSSMSIMRMNPNRVGDVQYAKSQANPYWLALNAQGTELFAADDQQGIDVYDVNSAAAVGRIQAGGVVSDLVLSPDGNWIFAPVSAAVPGVLVISPTTNQAVRFIPTPRLANGQGAPTSVAVSPDSRRIYVSISSASGGAVVCLDTVSREVVGRCVVGGQPLGVALTPDGRVLFCANNGSANVSVIDVTSMREVSRVHVGISPCRIAITPDGTKAYVTCKGSNEVAVISGTASVAQTIAVGNGPTGIAVTPDGRKVFVSNTSAGSISVIDTGRDVLENTTSEQLLSRPYGIAIARAH